MHRRTGGGGGGGGRARRRAAHLGGGVGCTLTWIHITYTWCTASWSVHIFVYCTVHCIVRCTRDPYPGRSPKEVAGLGVYTWQRCTACLYYPWGAHLAEVDDLCVTAVLEQRAGRAEGNPAAGVRVGLSGEEGGVVAG